MAFLALVGLAFPLWAADAVAVDVCRAARLTATEKSVALFEFLHPDESPYDLTVLSEDFPEGSTPHWIGGRSLDPCADYAAALAAQFRRVFFEPPPVVHLRPLATADRYGDPVFAPWQRRCPALAFNARLEPSLGASPHRRLAFGRTGFALYEVDADNDPATPPNVVFRSESFYDYWPLVLSDPHLPDRMPPADRNWNDIVPPESVAVEGGASREAGYALIDLDRCRVHWLTAIWMPSSTDLGCREHLEGIALLGGDPVILQAFASGPVVISVPYPSGEDWETRVVCTIGWRR
jgi:hypothetical protein